MANAIRKRVALAAVAALGAGLLSAVPAAATNAGSLAALPSNLYAGSPYVAAVTDLDTPTTASAGVAHGTTQATLGTASVTGNVLSVPFSFAAAAASNTVTVTYRDGANGATNQTVTQATVVVIAAPSISASTTPIRANSGQNASVRVTGTGTVESDVAFKYASVSAPAGGTVTFADTLASDANLSTATSATTVGTISVNASGAYAGVLYQDTNGNSIADPGEVQTVLSFSTAGAPTAAALSPATASRAAGATQTYTVTLSSNAVTTQGINGEFFTISADPTSATAAATLAGGDLTSIVAGSSGSASTAVIPFTSLADGVAEFTVAGSVAGDSIAITVTPSAALVAAGVTARSATLTTVAASTAAGKASVATSNTVIADTELTTTSLNAYLVDVSQATVTFNVTGLTPSAAVTYDVTATAGLTITRNTAAYTSGTDVTDVADASGNLTVVIAVTAGGPNANDTIVLDVNGDTADATGQVDATVKFATAAYSVTLTSPAVSPSLAVTGSAIAVTGSVKDQFGNPVAAATVTATGSVTPAGTALTGTATTSSTGAFSITLPAAAATTTSVSIVVSAVKTGIPSIASSAASVVNFSATGVPTSITLTPGVGNQTTTLPLVNVPVDGTVLANGLNGTLLTDATYTIANATQTSLTDAADEVLSFTVTSAPVGQVVITGSAGVLFSTSASADWQDYKATVTVAGSTTTVFAIAAVASAEHTVTATAGSTTASFKFRTAASAASGARNVAVTGPATIENGKVAVYTVKVTDNFGNPVNLTSATGSLTASITGPAFINGSLTTLTAIDTDADGEAKISVVGATSGTGSIALTVLGVNAAVGTAQFAAVAGSLNTTAGTNGFTASTASATQRASLVASTEVTANAAAIARVQEQVTALAASVTTLIAALSGQVKRLQTALTNVRRLIRSL